ncbi:MAG: peptide/nickel transport system substrate-binding protein, partial [Kosmotogales bacterium]|nr:peptide/nickel transport system substrate-binding protein [Kosmotogales bacterium]
MLKKGLLFSLVLVICLMAFAIQPGPFVDSVYVNVRMQEEIGLKDAAQGMTDVFAYGVNGPTLFGLPEEDLAKLEIYNVPSGSWSLLLNNIPDKAPYQVEVDEQT